MSSHLTQPIEGFKFITWNNDTGKNSLLLSGYVTERKNPECYFELTEISQNTGRTVDKFYEPTGIFICNKNGYCDREKRWDTCIDYYTNTNTGRLCQEKGIEPAISVGTAYKLATLRASITNDNLSLSVKGKETFRDSFKDQQLRETCGILQDLTKAHTPMTLITEGKKGLFSYGTEIK